MKIVLKLWWKDKVACAMLASWFAVMVAYIIINAKVLLMINAIVSNPENLVHKLILLGVICAVNTALSTVSTWFHQKAKNHVFIKTSNMYYNRLLIVDYQMYTKYSSSFVYNTNEFLWTFPDLMVQFVKTLLDVTKVITVLASIYILAGELILPIVVIYMIALVGIKFLYKKWNLIDKDNYKLKKARNQVMENIVTGFVEVRSFAA